ncbi:MAG: cytochrome c [Pseudomonadales bacterium]|nr:cytochrome c [Pseudomonadales bacterium]
MYALKSILMLGHPAKADVNYHAKAMLEAFKHHGDAFPEGSDTGKTHAKKKIWTDKEGFKDKGQAAGKAIMALIKVSESGDNKLIKSKFAGVGKSCKSCHDDYRKKGR